MSDKQAQTEEQTLPDVRAKLCELLELDASKATNDNDVVAAMGEWIGEQEERVNKAAERIANDPQRVKEFRAQVERDLDLARAVEEIEIRADERRSARKSGGQAPERKGEENLEEAARAKMDIVARVKSMQTRAFSGVTALALEGTETLKSVLDRPVPEDSEIKLLQRAHDDMVILAAACRVGASNNDRYMSLKDLRLYPKWQETFSPLVKAFSTSDASAWTPTYYSADMVENVYQATDVAGLFPRFPWPGPGSTATIPVEGTDLTMYQAGEATTDDDDPKYTASDPGLGTSITVTARAFAARTVWSYELEEDSIIPIIEHIRRKFVRCFARELDTALLDGDADGTHIDTGRTLADADHRKLFNGLRRKALGDSPVSGATYFNAEQIMTPLLNMGAYGQPSTSQELPANGTVGICSWATRLKLGFLRDTKDQRVGGDNSPLTSGISGLLGYPIIGSAKVLNDLNATGVYDASTTTKTYLLWVFVPAWHIYTKADLAMQIIDRPEQGQKVMVGRQRMAFEHMYPSTSATTRMVSGFADTAF